MASIQLEIPDEEIKAISQVAERAGLSPAQWLITLAQRETRRSRLDRPKYTLDELLSQCDPTAPLSEEEAEWLNAPIVGREVI